jgi:hypothetical protein
MRIAEIPILIDGDAIRLWLDVQNLSNYEINSLSFYYHFLDKSSKAVILSDSEESLRIEQKRFFTSFRMTKTEFIIT